MGFLHVILGDCVVDSFLGMIVAQGRFCREDELEHVRTMSYLKPSCDSSFSGYQDNCCPKWAILNLRRCGGATGLHACFVLEINGYPTSHEVNLLLEPPQSMGFEHHFPHENCCEADGTPHIDINQTQQDPPRWLFQRTDAFVSRCAGPVATPSAATCSFAGAVAPDAPGRRLGTPKPRKVMAHLQEVHQLLG